MANLETKLFFVNFGGAGRKQQQTEEHLRIRKKIFEIIFNHRQMP